MKEIKAFENLNRSRLLMLAALLCMFLVMLFCNLKTNLLADDFMYCFSFADDSRIDSLADCFPSIWAHRYNMNGRLISHFLVQVFLMLTMVILK